MINGFLMAMAIPFSIHYNDGATWSFITSALLTFSCGLGLRLSNKQSKDAEIKKRDGYLIVVLGWVSMVIFGSLPYIMSGEISNISNAFFETMSGFTTTGATILGDEGHKISNLPESFIVLEKYYSMDWRNGNNCSYNSNTSASRNWRNGAICCRSPWPHKRQNSSTNKGNCKTIMDYIFWTYIP